MWITCCIDEEQTNERWTKLWSNTLYDKQSCVYIVGKIKV